VVLASTSGMTNYTPGASKHFTLTVSGTGGNAGFELTARPASNLTGGVAGNLVAGTTTQALCKVGTTCAAGNPQYIRSLAATATPAKFDFDWTAPAGTEDVTLYVASAVGYTGSTYMGTYLLKASAGAPPPTLSVTPGSLSFAYQIGGTSPAAQTLGISGAATTYTAVASGGTWLSVTPASGGTSGSASVAVNTAGLAAGSYSGSVTVTAAGSTGSPMTVPVTLNVTPAAPTLTVSPASLSFAYQIGGTAPAAQTLGISGAATTYTAVASGGTWLSVTPASGGTSGSASVSVNAAGLAAGTYSGSVTITAAGSSGSPKTVPVTFTVTATAPTLTVSPASLSFAYQIGGTAPAAQTLGISGAATTYTAVASGGAWLSVTPASGGTSGSASVSVNTAGLAAGSYSGSVIVTAAGSTGSPRTVPVTFTVTAATPTLTVSPASLSFAYQLGGTAPAAQTLVIGGVASTFTAAASGGTWLSVSQASGSAIVSVNTTGMTAGTYSGSVTITAAGSSGSPMNIPVTLNVTQGAPTLTVSPASLSFAFQVGGTAPAAQTLNISGVTSTFTAAVSGGAWLSVSQVSGSASVSVNTAGLAAGSYSGTVTITATGSNGSPKTVPVTLTVTAASSTLTVSPASLSFSYRIGSDTPGSRTLTIGGAATTYTAVASGGTWLSVSPASGGTSGSARVSVRTSGLAAGSYSGTVTIAAVGSTGSPMTVPVTLTVTAPPVLTVSPASLAFAYQIGAVVPAAQTLTIGGVYNTFTAATSGGTWLSVSPASGGTTSATVSVNTAGLAAGTYSGTVTITAYRSTGSPMTVPVTLTVTPPPILTVSPASLTFAYRIGDPAAAAQVIAATGPSLNYTVAVSGGAWLLATPASGTTPGSIGVSLNTAGMVAGTYSATVTITAPGASNGPQVVAVNLTLKDPPPSLLITPGTVSMTCSTGNQSPIPYVLSVASSSTALSYTAVASGGSWLSVAPASGATPGGIFVSVNPAGLSAGATYNGSITITPGNPESKAQTIPVTLAVNGAGTSSCPVTGGH
jgi:hypothetical protein